MGRAKQGLNRWVRAVLWIGAGGILAVGALVVALKILFPPEKIKSLALNGLQTALGRGVRIAEAEIGLGGARLKGVEVSEVPGFEAGTLAKAQTAAVSLRLAPLLLRRKVVVNEVSVSDWELAVTRRADGTLNLSDRESPKESGSGVSTPPGEAPPAPVTVSRLRLEDGRVLYKDLGSGTGAELNGIFVSLDDFRLDAPFRARLSARFATTGSEPPRSGAFGFAGTLDPAGGNPAKASIDAESLTLEIGDFDPEFSGKVAGLSAPSADLAFTLPPLDKKSLAGIYEAPDGFALPRLKGRLKFAIESPEKLSIQEFSADGEGISLKASAHRAGNLWTLKGISLDWKPLSVSLDGTVRTGNEAGAPPELDLKIRSREINLSQAARLNKRAADFAPAGKSSVDLRVKGPAPAPKISGTLGLKNAGFTAFGQKLSGLNGAVEFTPETVKAAIKGLWNQGTLDLAVGASDYSGKRPRLVLNGTLSEFDLGTLPEREDAAPEPAEAAEKKSSAPAGPAWSSSGKITVRKIVYPKFSAAASTLDWDLAGISADLKGLSGRAAFRIGEGLFEDIKPLVAAKPAAKVILLPILVLQKAAKFVKVPLFPSFDKVKFKEITGDYLFKNGTLEIKESHLDSDAAYAKMTGGADLVEDSLDFRIATKLGGAALGNKISGPIGFSVKGTLAEPKVKLDPASILRQPGVDKAIKAGEKLLKKQGEQLLKGLFGK